MMQHQRMDYRQLTQFAVFTPDCSRQTPLWPAATNRPNAEKPAQSPRTKAPRDRRFTGS